VNWPFGMSASIVKLYGNGPNVRPGHAPLINLITLKVELAVGSLLRLMLI